MEREFTGSAAATEKSTLEGLQRAVLSILRSAAGGADKLLHDQALSTEILGASAALANNALRVRLGVGDINGLKDRTLAGIERLIELAENRDK